MNGAGSLSLGEARQLIEAHNGDPHALARIAECWGLAVSGRPADVAGQLWEHAEFCASTRDTAPRDGDDTGLTAPAGMSTA